MSGILALIMLVYNSQLSLNEQFSPTSVIVPTIKQQMDLKPREIIVCIKAKFNIKVSYMKAWDARRKAIKAVFGSWEESYRTMNLFMEVAFAMTDTTNTNS
ncbi:hypothetical protein M5K25_022393 [Dendrobium thyrsiflorum]|uniref:Uncharacterized protein n=1 Tax=Dendrobium thyrsiflorum TaxID=117978 RepID=A0ABD0U645_DENTH